jgi:hypothetical protein
MFLRQSKIKQDHMPLTQTPTTRDEDGDIEFVSLGDLAIVATSFDSLFMHAGHIVSVHSVGMSGRRRVRLRCVIMRRVGHPVGYPHNDERGHDVLSTSPTFVTRKVTR